MNNTNTVDNQDDNTGGQDRDRDGQSNTSANTGSDATDGSSSELRTGGELSIDETPTRGVFGRFKDTVGSYVNRSLSVRPITDADRYAIQQEVKLDAIESSDTPRLLRLKPAPENRNINAAIDMWEYLASLRDVQLSLLPPGKTNRSPVMSFEIWMIGDELTFNMFVTNDRIEETLKYELDSEYPEAEVETVWDAETVQEYVSRQVTGTNRDQHDVTLRDEHIPFLPVMNTQYFSAQTFTLRNDRPYPIRTHEQAEDEDQMRSDEEDYQSPTNDPYTALLGQMRASGENHCVFQVVVRPARENWLGPGWWYHVPWRTHPDEVIEELTDRDGTGVGRKDRERTYSENELSDNIRKKSKNDGYETNIRVIGFGNDEHVVEDLVGNVSGAVMKKFKGTEQGFVRRNPAGSDLRHIMVDSVLRGLREPMYLSSGEIGSIAHLPDESVESSRVKWAHGGGGNKIPPGAPSFDGPVENPFPANKKPVRYPADPARFETSNGTTTVETTTPSETPESNGTVDHDRTGTTTDRDVKNGTSREPGTTRTSEQDPVSEDRQDNAHRPGSGEPSYPDWLRSTLKPGEEPVYFSNQSKWVSAKLYSLAALLVPSGVVGVLYGVTGGGVEVTLAAAVAVLLGTSVAGYERKRRRNRWYVITDTRVLVKTGVLREDVSKFPMHKIQNWDVKQGFLQRTVLKTGEIVLYTAGSGEEEIELTWVRRIPTFTTELQSIHDQQSRHPGGTVDTDTEL